MKRRTFHRLKLLGFPALLMLICVVAYVKEALQDPIYSFLDNNSRMKKWQQSQPILMEEKRISEILAEGKYKALQESTKKKRQYKKSSLPATWPDLIQIDFAKREAIIPTNGVLYILGSQSPAIPQYLTRYENSGGRMNMYLKELEKSLDSLRRVNPIVSITLVVDDSSLVSNALWNKLDNIIIQRLKTEASWGDKEIGLMLTPYENTLFLDLDTLVCMPIVSMFKFLRFYDIAVVTEPDSKDNFLKSHAKTNDDAIDLVTDNNRIFETNSGMLLFRKSTDMFQFLLDVYEHHLNGSDQHYFHLTEISRGLLGKASNVRILQLPIEYNLRYHMGKEPIYLRGAVRIIHSRYTTCQIVNKVTSPRILDPIKNGISHYYEIDSKDPRKWHLTSTTK